MINFLVSSKNLYKSLLELDVKNPSICVERILCDKKLINIKTNEKSVDISGEHFNGFSRLPVKADHVNWDMLVQALTFVEEQPITIIVNESGLRVELIF